MRLTLLSGLVLGLLLLSNGRILLASQVDELRERAKALRKEAAVLTERGDKAGAEQFEKEVAKLLEAAERMELKPKGRGDDGTRQGIDKEMRQRKDRLQDLLAQEKKLQVAKAPKEELALLREQITRTERELQLRSALRGAQKIHPPEFQARAEKLEAAARRIHHYRVAAENLKMAEAHDLAHQLMEKAEAMEREVQEAKKQLAPETHKGHGGEPGPDVIRELRAEIEKLRAEVKELRQKIEGR